MASRSEQFTFEGAEGAQLAARLDLPTGEPRAYALFAHCFTCTKDIFAASRIAQELARTGIGVLRFDFTGLGASGGEFANTNFSSNVQDLIRAADHLRDTKRAPGILIGHSLGGAAVLAAAGDIPEVTAVATIAAPADPSHVAEHFQSSREEIEEKGEAVIQLVGRPFTIKKQFLEDIAAQKLEQKIASLRRALLVFHGPRDEIVGIDNATRIFIAAKHPKSFVSLDDADHLLSRRQDAIYVARVLGAWAEHYLPESADVGASQGRGVSLEPIEPGEVVVREAGDSRFGQEIMAGNHALRADEPRDVPGGEDSGPGPYDFLLAGLGACTSMTLRIYAEQKKWPLDRVTVQLGHEKIHAEDCADCETKEGKLDRIERKLTLEGDLDETQRNRLLEIADKCPVHRTLTSEIKIITELDSTGSRQS